MITDSQKIKIQRKLEDYCDRIGNQTKAANSMRNVTSATITYILSNRWNLVTDANWRMVGSQVGYSSKERPIVETQNNKILTSILTDARQHRNVFAVVDKAGSGKSTSTKQYTENSKGVYRLECKEFWNKRQFLSNLLAAIGRNPNGLDLNDLMDEIVRFIKAQNQPLIILDEFDKVKDDILYFFISLYNDLEDQCGIVLCSTDYLEKRIKKGLMSNKKGYQEIYSRIGRKFIVLPGVCSSDIVAICIANGITDKQDIKEIINDSDYDLRRVQRKIHALKISQTLVKENELELVE